MDLFPRIIGNETDRTPDQNVYFCFSRTLTPVLHLTIYIAPYDTRRDKICLQGASQTVKHSARDWPEASNFEFGDMTYFYI